MTDPTPPPDDPRPTGEFAAMLRRISGEFGRRREVDILAAADRLDALEAENRILARRVMYATAIIERLRGDQAAAVRAKAGLGEEGGGT